jgi:hypothetical protein
MNITSTKVVLSGSGSRCRQIKALDLQYNEKVQMEPNSILRQNLKNEVEKLLTIGPKNPSTYSEYQSRQE